VDLTVLIATRNRDESLRRTLESLTRQELGGASWEVVAVDNGSSDATRSVLDDFTTRLPLRALFEPAAGKNIALNRAVGAARGSVLLFTDDDVAPDPRWATEMLAATRRWPRDNVFGGRIDPRFPPETPSWLAAPSFPYGRWTFSSYHPRADEGPTSETPLGPSMALRRHLFDDRRFDETMGPRGEDYPMGSEVELLLRLYREGESFIYVPSARVEHVLAERQVQLDFLLERAHRCGRGNARLFPGFGNFPLFGVPNYQLQRAVAALAGVLVATLRGEPHRSLARLTWRQARGEVVERRRMLATGHPEAKRFPRAADVRDLAVRRGVLGALLAPLRLALSPLVRLDTFVFFEADASRSANHAPSGDDLAVEVLAGAAQEHAVRSAICRFEIMKPGVVVARLARGDRVAIARLDGEVVGYAWSAYSDLVMTEIGRTLEVGTTTVVGYDGFVSPPHRGRGILPALDAAQLRVAAEEGRARQLVYTSGRNRSTRRSMTRAGKRPVLRLAHLRVPLLGLDVCLPLGPAGAVRFGTAERD
jgi:GT2 family glycosyltransferase/GNAT superfamily N-acetyltransferase